MDFYLEIGKNQKKLNSGEEKTLNHILGLKNEIDKYTVRQMAEMNYVSPNTIIRMCKKLGFSGYAEFKSALKYAESHSDNLSMNLQDSLLEQLERSNQFLSKEIINNIIDVIKASNKIALFSSGLSRYVAEELEERFRIIGRKVHSFCEGEFKIHCAKRLTPDDCIIVFSVSGEQPSSIDALMIAKNRGVKIISVTGFSNNTISQLAHYPMYVFCTPLFYGGIDITNRFAFSYISTLIFQEYSKKYL